MLTEIPELTSNKYISLNLGNNISITAGRYGSALCHESEKTAGLYTLTRS